MNRCEVILDLQKAKGVRAPSVDLHIPQELERDWPGSTRIALTRFTYSYPNVPYHR